MTDRKIRTALISVYHKEGLDPIVRACQELNIQILSTGGTQAYIEKLGIPVTAVESLTDYPSILDGRVKTLHPKVFGGILARREQDHLQQLEQYQIPEIDLVIVDLYPFEETVKQTDEEAAIIEKIDIGGISLIRAAAKNYRDVLIVPSRDEYEQVLDILENQQGESTLSQRKAFALRAFDESSHYDVAIHNYFKQAEADASFKQSYQQGMHLRYGENPHQSATFFGDLSEMLEQLSGKALSYNNLVDIDAAVQLMAEFADEDPTFVVIKHTNACGVAIRSSLLEAWHAALAGDPVSAFGGILISNTPIDLDTAQEIHKLFYEVLIAPDFEPEALALLQSKKKRVLLKIHDFHVPTMSFKSLLNGAIQQDTDRSKQIAADLSVVTKRAPSEAEINDLLFANICAKHLKSNTIVLACDRQLIGMGCGQTSRVDALRQAIAKAKHFGFDTAGAVMASDAFFPFSDCVEIAHEAGVQAVIQPGGSIRDQDSIDACDENEMAMVTSGVRHFRH